MRGCNRYVRRSIPSIRVAAFYFTRYWSVVSARTVNRD